MIEALQRALSIPEVRQRILFVLGAFMVFAIGAHIPVPGLDHKKLEGMIGNMGGILALVDVFSGGALRRTSIFAMGINPYINASIIMQVMGIAIPALEQMQKEGEAGRKRIAKITRRLTVGLAIVQAFGLTVMFASGAGIDMSVMQRIQVIITLTAGSMFLLWLGEQITQKGVGNGISLIIFAGILLSLPYQVNLIGAQLKAGTISWLMVLFLVAVFVGTIYAVVYITQGTRRIPIQHTKRVIGMRQTQAGSSFLPIKVNSAGVIPIIFAISLLLFPSTLISAIPGQPGVGFIGWLKNMVSYLQPGNNYVATLFYALLVIGFTYFYTSIVMNVQEMADNLKKYGNYIPGIRPGRPTFEYLERVISRITLAGAVFLALIAVLQYILPGMSQFRSFSLIGGTSLLIVVGVAIETMQAIEAQLLMRNYEGFIKGSGQRSPLPGIQ